MMDKYGSDSDQLYEVREKTADEQYTSVVERNLKFDDAITLLSKNDNYKLIPQKRM